MSLVQARRDYCDRVDSIGDSYLTDNEPLKGTPKVSSAPYQSKYPTTGAAERSSASSHCDISSARSNSPPACPRPYPMLPRRSRAHIRARSGCIRSRSKTSRRYATSSLSFRPRHRRATVTA
jgi:hypothetical protein